MSAAGSFHLAATGGGRYAASGPLTFATARRARELGMQALAGAAGSSLELACGGVTAVDSAGLAVLLDWLGVTRRAGCVLRYTQLPQGLLALARISEVADLLAPAP